MLGSKVKIWKQDPTVKPIGVRTSYIHTKVEDGPKDSEIEIEGMPTVIGNSDNDFLFLPEENPKEFDAVHTYAVVRQVLTMYKRALKRIKYENEFRWQWGSDEPIKINPRAGIQQNAYYSRSQKSLRFYYFHPGENEMSKLVYTCRSFDIVAHETGHAILDALKPNYLSNYKRHSQTGGLHESFGDLTAIFTMLAQLDQCEAIIAESKTDLHSKTFFPIIAEQFGKAVYGRTTGLRNADKNYTLNDVSNRVHDISKVFTGAIYDILAGMFELANNQNLRDPAETLFNVGNHLCDLVLRSIIDGPDDTVTYREVAEKMMELEDENEIKKIIEKQFSERLVFESPLGLSEDQVEEPLFDNCCGTLQHKEYFDEG